VKAPLTLYIFQNLPMQMGDTYYCSISTEPWIQADIVGNSATSGWWFQIRLLFIQSERWSPTFTTLFCIFWRLQKPWSLVGESLLRAKSMRPCLIQP
jgi:hypothetical protein